MRKVLAKAPKGGIFRTKGHQRGLKRMSVPRKSVPRKVVGTAHAGDQQRRMEPRGCEILCECSYTCFYTARRE